MFAESELYVEKIHEHHFIIFYYFQSIEYAEILTDQPNRRPNRPINNAGTAY